MRKNLEIKTPISDYKRFKRLSFELISNYKKNSHFIETQKDVYFDVPDKRLKLRIINSGVGVIIYYDRNESSKKRVSNYHLAETGDFDEAGEIFKKLFGVKVVVEKVREIFLFKNVRIHLDRVKGLGNFMEFEIIYKDLNGARKELRKLIEHFKLNEDLFIKGSYSDMLIKVN